MITSLILAALLLLGAAIYFIRKWTWHPGRIPGLWFHIDGDGKGKMLK